MMYSVYDAHVVAEYAEKFTATAILLPIIIYNPTTRSE
jgi:hypothetical protein